MHFFFSRKPACPRAAEGTNENKREKERRKMHDAPLPFSFYDEPARRDAHLPPPVVASAADLLSMK